MKNATLLLSVFASAMLTSCAGVSPTRIISNTVGAAGGALIGQKFSGGDPLVTTASAGAGVLLSETLQAGSNASAQKSYDAWYDKACSDSAKQQFQSLNERQRLGPQLDDRTSVRLSKCRCPSARRTASSSRPAPQSSAFRNKATAPMKFTVFLAGQRGRERV